MAVIGRKSKKPNLYIIWRELQPDGKRIKRYKSTGTTDTNIAAQQLEEFKARRLLGRSLVAPAAVATPAPATDPYAEHRGRPDCGTREGLG